MLPLLVQYNTALLRTFELTVVAGDLNLIMHSLLVSFQVVRICCFVIAQLAEKADPVVHLSHVKSHHLFCPRLGFAFFTLVLGNIVFAFHMSPQHIILCAHVLALWALYQIPSVPPHVILKTRLPLR